LPRTKRCKTLRPVPSLFGYFLGNAKSNRLAEGETKLCAEEQNEGAGFRLSPE
jgi:hypothetical protein